MLSHERFLSSTLLAVLVASSAFACTADPEPDEDIDAQELGMDAFKASVKRGKKLFKNETFGGNGRTCATCHTASNGTVTAEQIQEAFAEDPTGPLFRAIDSDDGTGASYDRMLTEATFRITLDLPANISLKFEPEVRTIHVFRNTLTNFDSPALDPLIMWDARQRTLEDQALAAIHEHAENTIEPTEQQLTDIANFQRDQLFSDHQLDDFAHGGPLPTLPAGHTPSQKRGRAHFEITGVCGCCHASSVVPGIPPLVNGAPADNSTPEEHNFGLGVRTGPTFISELAGQGNDTWHPKKTYTLTTAANVVVEFESRDPGMVIPFSNGGGPDHLFKPPTGVPLINEFKIPNLRNVRKTAPYFHDGSAATLEDVIEAYRQYFVDPRFIARGICVPPEEARTISVEAGEDMIHWMKML